MRQRPSKGDDTHWKAPQVSMLDVYLQPVTHCPYTQMFSPREAEPDSNIYHLWSFPLKDTSLRRLVSSPNPRAQNTNVLCLPQIFGFPLMVNDHPTWPTSGYVPIAIFREPLQGHMCVRHQPRRQIINHLDVTRNNTSLRHILPKPIPYLNAIYSTQILLAKLTCFR